MNNEETTRTVIIKCKLKNKKYSVQNQQLPASIKATCPQNK